MIELAAGVAMERLSRRAQCKLAVARTDYRPEIADDNCLRPLADRLEAHAR